MAFVVWAAVLEARRPRRGWPVLVLLGLAGLLRPEAWLYAGAYWLWLFPARDWPDRLKLLALAAAAPVIWALSDLVITGDLLWSFHGTHDLAARFAVVDERHRQRHALLERQVDLLGDTLSAAAPRLEALRAACRQADTAREHARVRPAVASAVTSLRVAEEILADARARLPVQALPGSELPEVNSQLATSDTALAFARAEFNAAVTAYNDSVRQFPTVLIARLFSFRAAASF